MHYQVMKPFSGDGRMLEPGEIVSDAEWPVGRAAKLVAQRRLMPAGVDGDTATLPRIGSRRPRSNDPNRTGRSAT